MMGRAVDSAHPPDLPRLSPASGARCGYYHHLPIEEECDMYDMVHDIFGRQRYATHRDRRTPLRVAG